MNIKTIMSLFILPAFLLATVWFFISVSSYFDPLDWCRIGINGDIMNGNEKTIKAALGLLKKTDMAAYKDLCRWVDRIGEKNCIIADQLIDAKRFQEGWDLPGCYVNGTKTIYIKPTKSESPETIEERAWALKHYSAFSKTFWEEHGRQ